MAWKPSDDFEQTLAHALDLSLGKWRDELSGKTVALRPDHVRRGISESGAAAQHTWSSVWAPMLGGLPERFVSVAMELFDAHRARLTKDAAEWLSSMIDGRFGHLTEGLQKESDSLFPPRGFRHLLPELMRRLAIQARAEINRRYDLARFSGEGRVDQLVVEALSRAALDEDLPEAINRAEPFSVVFCDLDHFKALNDTHGHPAGDEALRAFARLAKAAVGERGRVYRYGGDEFVVLLHGSPTDAENVIAELQRIESAAITPHPVLVGVSAGSASFPGEAETAAIS